MARRSFSVRPLRSHFPSFIAILAVVLTEKRQTTQMLQFV